MATVPHSRKITDAIIANAVAPFDTAMREVTQQITTDDTLLRCINIDQSNEEQTRLAEQLCAINPAWFSKNYIYIQIQFEGRTFQIDCDGRANTAVAHTTIVYNYDRTGAPLSKDTPVFARFNELYSLFKRANDDKHALSLAIETVVEATPNLQRAVEIMPALLNWFPDDVRKRYNAPKAAKAPRRASAEEVKAEAFTPEALAAMARARMSQP